MATLTDKAILELIVDASKGAATLDEFQSRFTEKFAELEVSAGQAGESIDGLGQSVFHLTDPLRGAAVATGEASGAALEGAANYDQLASALRRIPGPAGQSIRALGTLGKAVSSLPAPIAATVATLAAAVLQFEALYQGSKLVTKGLTETLEATNEFLPGLEDRLRFIGQVGPQFVELADKLKVYIAAHREGTAALRDDAAAHEEFNQSVARLKESISGNVGALQLEFRALLEVREELERADKFHGVALENWTRLAGNLAEKWGTVRDVVPDALREIAEASKEAAESEQERWDFLGESLEETVTEYDEATEATVDNTKAVEKSVPAYRKAEDAIAATTDVLRDQVQALRESVRAQREAAGIDDREQSVSDLREEIEALEDAEFRTVEQENRIDQAKQELIDTERQLQDALAETNLFYDEQNLELDEASLAALEYEEKQRRLAEALGETAETQGDVTDATEEAADAYGEQEENVAAVAERIRELQAAVTAADPVVAAFIARMNAGLLTSVDLLKQAKQCAIDLGGALDDV